MPLRPKKPDPEEPQEPEESPAAEEGLESQETEANEAPPSPPPAAPRRGPTRGRPGPPSAERPTGRRHAPGRSPRRAPPPGHRVHGRARGGEPADEASGGGEAGSSGKKSGKKGGLSEGDRWVLQRLLYAALSLVAIFVLWNLGVLLPGYLLHLSDAEKAQGSADALKALEETRAAELSLPAFWPAATVAKARETGLTTLVRQLAAEAAKDLESGKPAELSRRVEEFKKKVTQFVPPPELERFSDRLREETGAAGAELARKRLKDGRADDAARCVVPALEAGPGVAVEAVDEVLQGLVAEMRARVQSGKFRELFDALAPLVAAMKAASKAAAPSSAATPAPVPAAAGAPAPLSSDRQALAKLLADCVAHRVLRAPDKYREVLEKRGFVVLPVSAPWEACTFRAAAVVSAGAGKQYAGNDSRHDAVVVLEGRIEDPQGRLVKSVTVRATEPAPASIGTRILNGVVVSGGTPTQAEIDALATRHAEEEFAKAFEREVDVKVLER
ncbi:MAG: hypothetical protein HYZ53_24490 [Planctomycetes bacterium]|nr:hypothetical protein [Planctomycetota bacterium]